MLIKSGADVEEVFHYLTFRILNRASDNARFLLERATAFNEVMAQVADEYEQASFTTDSGPALVINDVEAIQDASLATIIDRPDLRVGERSLNISALIYDENGSRVRLFEEAGEAAPADGFGFDDHGETRYPTSYRRVHEAIEEREGRRLASIGTIRTREFKPFNSDVLDAEGNAQGEAHGVLVFPRLPVDGDRFTVLIQGLSNKLRFGDFEIQQGVPAEPNAIQDYFNAHLLRRTMEVEISRPGDEYHLDRVGLKVVHSGWSWRPAFVRLRHRASMAYSKFFLDNVAEGGRGERNEAVEGAFWQYYNGTVAEAEARYEAKLATLAKDRAAVEERCEELIVADEMAADLYAIIKDRRLARIGAREAAVREQLEALRNERPDFQAATEEQ
ncbi:MAG: hypothetical protein ACYTF0_02895 [Planctomycetota bacterium]